MMVNLKINIISFNVNPPGRQSLEYADYNPRRGVKNVICIRHEIEPDGKASILEPWDEKDQFIAITSLIPTYASSNTSV